MSSSPINPGNRKVLLFTAFADTADYLYEHLSLVLRERHGLHTARVVGSDRPKSTPARKADYQELLMLFSPVSKEKALLLPDVQDEIDLLIATDGISEGQNLQLGIGYAAAESMLGVFERSAFSCSRRYSASLSTAASLCAGARCA